jgi:hypothetical protein
MFALLLLIQGAVIEGKGSPTADIPRLEASPRIDGRLDEPVWSQATRLTGFWQYQPVDGRLAEEQTEVLVWIVVLPLPAPPSRTGIISTTMTASLSISTPFTIGAALSSSG